MTTLKKISYFNFALCVLLWAICGVESAITAEASKSRAPYTRTDDKEQMFSSSILDSLYQRSRQSRCVTCYEDKRYGNDRRRYYGSYASRPDDDRARSSYYSNYDRYEDRGYRGAEYDRYASAGADRYGDDRYGADRYGTTGYRYAGYRDDSYGSRPSYDRYDSRTRGSYDRLPVYDRGESRGYGYDNRDRYYGTDRGPSDNYGRDRYYERPRSGAGSYAGYGGYDRDYYDRYSPRGPPGHQEDHQYLPEPDYNSRCGFRKPNCPYHPQEEGTRVTSDTLNSGYHNMGVSQTTYDTNSNSKQNGSSKGSNSSSNWSYMREDEEAPRGGNNSGSYAGSSSNNRERQSSGYGALLDRDSNLIAVEPVKSSADENANDSMASSDMQNDNNVDDTPKQSDKGQNS